MVRVHNIRTYPPVIGVFFTAGTRVCLSDPLIDSIHHTCFFFNSYSTLTMSRCQCVSRVGKVML